jgi:hypothetical protein
MHGVEDVYIEQQKGKASTEGKEQLASKATEREKAYIRSAEKKKELVKHIERTDLELRILREALEQQLRNQLLPLDLLRDPEEMVDESDDDLADSESKANDNGRQDLVDEALAEHKDPAEKLREEALQNLNQAKARLLGLQLRFDNNKQFYGQDLADYAGAVAQGQCDVSRTVFDLTHVSELHELPQDLMGAERRYQEAACQARCNPIDSFPNIAVLRPGRRQRRASRGSCHVDHEDKYRQN